LVVADMAAEAHLSPAHFSRAFTEVYGEPPHRYLLRRRLERAAALLRSTDRSVTEICFMVGLSSLGSFSASFKRIFGSSPSEYRRAHPPASALARIPPCVVRQYGRPQHRSFGEERSARDP
jgi:AraC-like DNA-binding protein